jgi:hypothetical protein
MPTRGWAALGYGLASSPHQNAGISCSSETAFLFQEKIKKKIVKVS